MINLNNKKYAKISLFLIFTATLLQGCSIEIIEYSTVHRTACIGEAFDECELVSVNFWNDSTNMQISGESTLRDAARKFRSNPTLAFQIEGTSSFSFESDDIGLRRAHTIKSFLIKEHINPHDIKILASKDRECLLLISKNISWGMDVCIEDSACAPYSPCVTTYTCYNLDEAELISLDFWIDSTDMQYSSERALRDATRKFRSNPRLTFQIEGKSKYRSESDDIGLCRAHAIKSFLINEHINPHDIKILSSKGRECLILLSS